MVTLEIQSTTHADRYRAAAEEFARRVTDALGEQVDSIVLYGSVARGEAGPQSDIDVLVVGPNTTFFWNSVGEIAYDLTDERDFTFVLSEFLLDREQLMELNRIGTPFIRNVISEGEVIHDNGIFSRVRSRATEVG